MNRTDFDNALTEELDMYVKTIKKITLDAIESGEGIDEYIRKKEIIDNDLHRKFKDTILPLLLRLEEK